MQIATVNNKLTSKYLLDFEQEKGTPENSIFQEYLEVITTARTHIQHYEELVKDFNRYIELSSISLSNTTVDLWQEFNTLYNKIFRKQAKINV